MNKVFMIGRLTKDVELKEGNNGVSFARFGIAVDKWQKNEDGERDCDFFDCVAFRGIAETLAKYCKKGHRVAIVGEVHNRNYEASDGTKRSSVEISINDMELLDKKDGSNTAEKKIADKKKVEDDDFLPF